MTGIKLWDVYGPVAGQFLSIADCSNLLQSAVALIDGVK
jgi:hypothetical protein